MIFRHCDGRSALQPPRRPRPRLCRSTTCRDGPGRGPRRRGACRPPCRLHAAGVDDRRGRVHHGADPFGCRPRHRPARGRGPREEARGAGSPHRDAALHGGRARARGACPRRPPRRSGGARRDLAQRRCRNTQAACRQAPGAAAGLSRHGLPGRERGLVSHSFRFDGFGDLGGRAWLNTAHQGALPLAAAAEAQEAIGWKLAPHNLTQARFDGVPRRLRAALGRLVNVPADDIILANSASYGLHLLALGYPWREGDEVLAMAGDFPSDILPWLLLERRHGVRLVRIRPRDRVVLPEELAQAITPRTRLFCTTWVHSLSGYAIDLDALGAICRARGVTFLVNASQALGARPLDLSRAPVDALTCVGFKWLCGPYGTGFCWIKPTLREQLRPLKAYWLAMQTAADLGREAADPELRDGLDARGFDVFGTANFLNFKPLAAAVEHILAIGVSRIAAHDQTLVARFVAGLEGSAFELLSPRAGGQRSTLVFFSHRERGKNAAIHAALAESGVDVAFRNGSLRLSPHLYNAAADIDRALDLLRNTRL